MDDNQITWEQMNRSQNPKPEKSGVQEVVDESGLLSVRNHKWKKHMDINTHPNQQYPWDYVHKYRDVAYPLF